MDTNKLIVSGHSFGGMTAIATAKIDKRVKACCVLDGWLFCKDKEINE
jgi:cephalosporin-C deacetylase-like acetyl esterase